MKYFLGVISFIFSLTANCQNPFDTLKFDKVVMYDFNDKGQEIPIIDKYGKLDNSVTQKVVLDKKIVDELTQKLGDKSSYESGVAMCYSPHLGLVYYKKETIVASITICLMCRRLESSIWIPAQIMGEAEQDGEKIYELGGLSESMKVYLSNLVKANKFSHPGD